MRGTPWASFPEDPTPLYLPPSAVSIENFFQNFLSYFSDPSI